MKRKKNIMDYKKFSKIIRFFWGLKLLLIFVLKKCRGVCCSFPPSPLMGKKISGRGKKIQEKIKGQGKKKMEEKTGGMKIQFFFFL